jgi:hypothetical protein
MVKNKALSPGAALVARRWKKTSATQRTELARRMNAAKVPLTHCHRGHPFDHANTYVTKDGAHRQCRTCQKIRTQGT